MKLVEVPNAAEFSVARLDLCSVKFHIRMQSQVEMCQFERTQGCPLLDMCGTHIYGALRFM